MDGLELPRKHENTKIHKKVKTKLITFVTFRVFVLLWHKKRQCRKLLLGCDEFKQFQG
jgi:hypothetical protein